MRILNRYLLINMLKVIGSVVLVGAAIEFFLLLVTEMADMGVGDYGFFSVLSFVVLSLPNTVYQFFPMLALLGSILALGQMASSNELVVMRSSGISLYQMLRMVLWSSLIIVVFATVLGEGVGVRLSAYADEVKHQKMHPHQTEQVPDVWVKKNNEFINISSLSENQLSDITVFKFNNNRRLQSLFFAKSGHNTGKSWKLNDASSTLISDQVIQVKRHPLINYPLFIFPKFFEMNEDTEKSQSLHQLYGFLKYQSAHNLQSTRISFSFWQRCLQPLSTLIIMLLAIPFVFHCFGRVQMAGRILLGILISFVFYMGNQFLGPFALLVQWPPLLSALMPIMLMIVIEFVIFMAMA